MFFASTFSFALLFKDIDWSSSLRRHSHTVNPTHEVFSYSFGTGVSTLRAHLVNEHIEQWVESCDKFKIPITAEAAKGPVANYRASGGASAPSSDRPPNIREYSYEAFVDAITEFIIADDQVHFFPVISKSN